MYNSSLSKIYLYEHICMKMLIWQCTTVTTHLAHFAINYILGTLANTKTIQH